MNNTPLFDIFTTKGKWRRVKRESNWNDLWPELRNSPQTTRHPHYLYQALDSNKERGQEAKADWYATWRRYLDARSVGKSPVHAKPWGSTCGHHETNKTRRFVTDMRNDFRKKCLHLTILQPKTS